MLQASNVKLQYKNQFTNINIYNLKKKSLHYTRPCLNGVKNVIWSHALYYISSPANINPVGHTHKMADSWSTDWRRQWTQMKTAPPPGQTHHLYQDLHSDEIISSAPSTFTHYTMMACNTSACTGASRIFLTKYGSSHVIYHKHFPQWRHSNDTPDLSPVSFLRAPSAAVLPCTEKKKSHFHSSSFFSLECYISPLHFKMQK